MIAFSICMFPPAMSVFPDIFCCAFGLMSTVGAFCRVDSNLERRDGRTMKIDYKVVLVLGWYEISR